MLSHVDLQAFCDMATRAMETHPVSESKAAALVVFRLQQDLRAAQARRDEGEAYVTRTQQRDAYRMRVGSSSVGGVY